MSTSTPTELNFKQRGPSRSAMPRVCAEAPLFLNVKDQTHEQV
jgi:hypothetical protein